MPLPSTQPSTAVFSSLPGVRRGFWHAMWLELAGLLLFVLFFNLVAPNLGAGLSTGWRIALGLAVAILPAALWLSFFLGLDAREPEPRQLVVRTLIAGALAWAALAGPLLHGLFAVDAWLGATLWSRLLGGILVVGVIEQTVVYLAVRYTIFERPDFNERIDGVVYGVAAGLGIATVINLTWVLERGGVDLDVGSVRVVVNTLAYGAIAGVLGYFIGQARFRRVPIWYLPAGLALSALLSGLLFFLLEGSGDGLQVRPAWGDLALAAVVAVLALAAVFGLAARAYGEPPLLTQPSPTVPAPAQPAPARRDPVRRDPVQRPAPRALTPLPIAAAHDAPDVVEELDSPPADSTDEADGEGDGQAAGQGDRQGAGQRAGDPAAPTQEAQG